MSQPRSNKGAITAFALKLLGLLPLPACRALGYITGEINFLLKTKSYRITMANIAHCLTEVDKAKQRQLARESLRQTAMTMVEMSAIWQKPYRWIESHIIKVNGAELLEPTADGKGIVVIAPHIGNWEVLGLYLPSLQPIVSLYQPPKMAELEQLIRQGREKTGATLVATNRRGVMQILKHLRAGGMTGILPDQLPNDSNSGMLAPFFGQTAWTMTLVSNLIQKTQARAVCGYAKRVPGGFEIEFFPADESIYSDDEATSVAGLNASVEQCVRNIPNQYQWEYKRFRRLPAGMKNIYRNPPL